MIIQNIRLDPYQIKFKQPFQTASGIHEIREGLIISIETDEHKGFGEAAPLPGFSPDLIFECRNQIEGFIFALKNDHSDIMLDDLLSLVDVHTLDSPAARFGLQTALFDNASQHAGLPLSKFLNAESLEKVTLNGIAGIHNPGDGYSTLKVKMGFRNLFDEIEYMEKLTLDFGTATRFRLDCNENLDLPRAIRFCKEMERFNVEYLEQPLPRHDLEDLCELRFHTEIPIAVDESLTNLSSAEKIIEYQAADVFVIKPMITGSFKECDELVKLARSEKIKPIITSSLENAVGLSACTHLAAAIQIEDACGLATGSLLKLSQNGFPIENGFITIPEKSGLGFFQLKSIKL